MNRRSFLTATAAATTLSGLAPAASGLPSNRLRLGFLGVGSRGHALLAAALQASDPGNGVEIAAVCDVYDSHRQSAVQTVKTATGRTPSSTVEYRDLLADETINAVVVATPDHWHARMALDALRAGKHVYCEKPMTRTVAEAVELLRAWQSSKLVMQIGVQCTQLPVWKAINQFICDGRLGKIMQFQTEFFRNSAAGQWRNYSMRPEMTPQTVDWGRFLGLEFGLAPDLPFDREVFAQWRRYWAFGSGMFTDLFVHRVTAMLLATGLRFPARVVGAAGIYLELDGRQAPDVGAVVADYDEGVQGIVTATMCAEETPLRQLIRGHHASAVLGTGEDFTGFDFVAERPQVTLNASVQSERIETGGIADTTLRHMENFLAAVRAEAPEAVTCSPELGAAALVTTLLGARSYREGRVFHFSREELRESDGDSNWADKWEQRSAAATPPSHVAGWRGGNRGSELHPPPDVLLRGPWTNGRDPSQL